MRKLISLLLILTMIIPIFSAVVPVSVSAEQDNGGIVDISGCTPIYTADDFMNMSKTGGRYYLANDIDLTGRTFAPGNWGTTEEWHNLFKDFVLEGNNKTLTIDRSIFNTLQNSEIRNLTLVGAIRYQVKYIYNEYESQYGTYMDTPYLMSPLTSDTASDSSYYTKNITLKNITSKVSIDYVQSNNSKGVAGVISSVRGESSLENVKFEGAIKVYRDATQIWANHDAARDFIPKFMYVAGICGTSSGTTTFNNCSASGSISISAEAHSGTAAYAGVGGIVGTAGGTSLSLTDCTNNMAIDNKSTDTEVFVGGLVGTTHDIEVSFENCTNTGDISSYFLAGGILGECANTNITQIKTVNAANCINTGDIRASQAAGIISSAINGEPNINSCRNDGDITCTGRILTLYRGLAGILGVGHVNNATITGCTNTGDLLVSASNAVIEIGGIVGILSLEREKEQTDLDTDKQGTYTISGCKNTGNITSSRDLSSTSGTGTGGIVGNVWGSNINNTGMSQTLNITSCVNDGKITPNNNATTNGMERRGGIAGYIVFIRYVNIEGCLNNGDIYAPNDTVMSGTDFWDEGCGGIIGTYRVIGHNQTAKSALSNFNVKNCINNGNINVSSNAAGILGNSTELYNWLEMRFYNCINNGDITSKDIAAGIYARLSRGGSIGPYVAFTDCINNGNILATTTVGGMVGSIYGELVRFTRCVNSGDLKTHGGTVGGMAGKIYHATGSASGDKIECLQSVNVGVIEGHTVGAMIAVVDGAKPITATDCVNMGKIKQTFGDGSMIVASWSTTLTVNGCIYLAGTVKSEFANGAASADKDLISSKMDSLELCAYDSEDLERNYAFATEELGGFDYGENKSAIDSAKANAFGLLNNPFAKQAELKASNIVLYEAMWNYTPHFVVTIPATVDVTVGADISASVNNLTPMASLSVSVSAMSDTLINQQGGAVGYTVKADGETIKSGDVIIALDSENLARSVRITATLDGTATAGVYSGSMTFGVSLNSAKYDMSYFEASDKENETPDIDRGAFDEKSLVNSAALPNAEASGYFYVKNMDIGNGSVMYIAKCDGAEQYNKYLYLLEQAGFDFYTDNAIGDNLYTTFATKTQIVNAVYMKGLGEMRVMVDVRRQSGEYGSAITNSAYASQYEYIAGFDLPALDDGTVYTDAELAESAFVCVAGNFYGWVGKMGYIFKLADGSFYIIDGGYTSPEYIADVNDSTKTQAAKYIMDVLEKYADDPNNIRVSWMLTHLHEDHIGALVEFSRNQEYMSRVTVDTLIYSQGSLENCKSMDASASWPVGLWDMVDGMNSVVAAMKPQKVVKAYPGQHFTFGNLKMDVLTSQELLLHSPLTTIDATLTKGNDATVVTRVEFMGKKMLFMGDSSFESNPYSVKPCYWNALADIDILQVAHHGYTDTTAGDTVYVYCPNLSIVLWPVDARHFYGTYLGYLSWNGTTQKNEVYGGVAHEVAFNRQLFKEGITHYIHNVYDDIYFEFDGDRSTWWTPEMVLDQYQIYDSTKDWNKSTCTTYNNTAFWSEYWSVYGKDKS